MARQLSFGFGPDPHQPLLPGMSNLTPVSLEQGTYRSSALGGLTRSTDPRQLSLGFKNPGQASFNFAGAKRNRFVDFFTKKEPFRHTARGIIKGLPLEIALGAAFTVAGTIRGGAAWGAPTGLPEDYVGGAVYGGIKAGFSTAGSITGGIVGATIGSVVPGVGTVIGGFIGGVVGGISGDYAGGAFSNNAALRLGLAARAVVRTARAVDRVQFGGGLVDNPSLYTMRQAAVSEMSGGLLNARSYLGNEASLFHG